MPAVKSSLVHPRYKTEYRVRNWREYEQGLRARGDLTIWFSEDVLANWISRPTGRPGGPRLYSDLAIETSLTLRTVFGLPLRQTEGFVVVPPTQNARVSKSTATGALAQNATVHAVRELGRREWKKQSGYHRQARVENAFYRYKQIFGGKLRSRNVAVQATEVGLAVKVLNRMLELGAARSEAIHN